MNERSGHRVGRPVISSLTGKPITWQDPQAPPTMGRERPIVPDRPPADEPEAGEEQANDAQLLRDVPPHWGRGQ